MFAMITTEEYKELIQAQTELAEAQDALLYSSRSREEAEDSLKELLLMLTKGNTKVQYGEEEILWYELEEKTEIAKYISENYVVDGRLQFTKATKEENILEKMANILTKTKEITNEQSN